MALTRYRPNHKSAQADQRTPEPQTARTYTGKRRGPWPGDKHPRVKFVDRPIDPAAVNLTKRQYAREANISLSTINRLIKQGQLKIIKYGKAVRIPRDSAPRAATGG